MKYEKSNFLTNKKKTLTIIAHYASTSFAPNFSRLYPNSALNSKHISGNIYVCT